MDGLRVETSHQKSPKLAAFWNKARLLSYTSLSRFLFISRIDSYHFAEAKISRKARFNFICLMHNTATINDTAVPINENYVFMRMVCIMKGDTKKAEYLNYELSPQPPAQFVGSHMRETEKSAFVTLFAHVSPQENMTVDSRAFVIYGGYILHAATTT
ncbi:hypothetical protein PR048_018581 [Dryococelus australis]|uniref:Uncharacterized protein n=1 Tax=Dryococelus australis TaxID=614101 RepID=A0ABQ9HCQ6_9NEOP|nr:hypothetical protein PR048_018581 [Dryococelus australis]